MVDRERLELVEQLSLTLPQDVGPEAGVEEHQEREWLSRWSD